MDVREILHWLVDRTSSPEYARADATTPEEVHAAIDDAHGWKAPEPALTPEEAAQLQALQDKQAQVTAAQAG